MTILENDLLKIGISNTGAQLTSFYNKTAGIEHMWQGDPAIWPWHAPNLFPVIGTLIDNQLLVDGRAYTLTQRHGFARYSEFLPIEANSEQAKFSLPYCEKTLAVYPYKFDFQILYDLIDNALRITYKVINMDHQTIYFSVGGHPAFNVPFFPGEKYDDYALEFETKEKLETHLLASDGCFNGETQPVPLKGQELPITHELFANDALVFKNMKSRQVTIKSDQHEHTLSVQFPHFNQLGIWAKTEGDFVCIEPWLGCADTEGKHVDIKQKEGIQKLHQGHVFEASFYISI